MSAHPCASLNTTPGLPEHHHHHHTSTPAQLLINSPRLTLHHDTTSHSANESPAESRTTLVSGLYETPGRLVSAFGPLSDASEALRQSGRLGEKERGRERGAARPQVATPSRKWYDLPHSACPWRSGRSGECVGHEGGLRREGDDLPEEARLQRTRTRGCQDPGPHVR